MAQMPKRRKSKDNPYKLDYNDNEHIYTVTFLDNKNVIQTIVISEDIFKAFDNFELEDIKELNEYDRHIEHSEIFENNLIERAADKSMQVEEIVENQIISEELKKAIQELPKIQRKRLKKYYFEDKSFEEIAREEHCTKRAVKFSVDIALEKISKKFNN